MPYRRDIDDFIQHSFPEIRLEKRRTLSESLQKASLVIAGESSGVLEALAYGVRVVLPLRPDSPLVTPLSENKDLFDSPATPEELKKILSPVHSMRDLSLGSGQEFIRLVWNLDKSLARWKSLLNSIPVRAVRSPL
jgi:hypothetical protein